MYDNMPKFVRAIPLTAVLVSYTVCGALLWLGNGWVRWAHIILMAAAISLACTPSLNLLQRVFRGVWIGLLVSLLLVGLSLTIGWIGDRQHFFDDGGPIAGLLIVEFYVGLPMVALAVVFSAAAPVRSRLTTRQTPA